MYHEAAFGHEDATLPDELRIRNVAVVIQASIEGIGDK